MSSKGVTIKNLVKAFPGRGLHEKETRAVDGISLTIEPGEFVTLLGPSGCGKTTTLRMIAGFETPNSGEIRLGDQLINSIVPDKRDTAMVFQSYALFPNYNVWDNIGYGLKLKKLPAAVIKEKIEGILSLVGLTGLEKRAINQLSGGQQQRVALARALVIEPKLLLLDEPLSNLDAKLRISMRVEIKRLQKKLGITTLFVTHDQEECFSISDKVAVMNNGVIEQYDTPENIYQRPATEFVARFIGFENFLELKKIGEHSYTAPDGSAFDVDMECSHEHFAGTVRPDDIRLAEDGRRDNVLTGTIGVRTFLGKSYQYEVNTAAGPLRVNMETSRVFEEGQEIRLYLPKDKLVLVRR